MSQRMFAVLATIGAASSLVTCFLVGWIALMTAHNQQHGKQNLWQPIDAVVISPKQHFEKSTVTLKGETFEGGHLRDTQIVEGGRVHFGSLPPGNYEFAANVTLPGVNLSREEKILLVPGRSHEILFHVPEQLPEKRELRFHIVPPEDLSSKEIFYLVSVDDQTCEAQGWRLDPRNQRTRYLLVDQNGEIRAEYQSQDATEHRHLSGGSYSVNWKNRLPSPKGSAITSNLRGWSWQVTIVGYAPMVSASAEGRIPELQRITRTIASAKIGRNDSSTVLLGADQKVFWEQARHDLETLEAK